MALSPLTIKTLNLLQAIHNWEDSAVSFISKKTNNRDTVQISKRIQAAITQQIISLTDGANTDEARAAMLPRLQMEVDGLQKYGHIYLADLI